MFTAVINDSAFTNNANEFESCFSASSVGFELVNSLNVDDSALNTEPQQEPEPYLHTDYNQHMESHEIEQSSQILLGFDQALQHVDELIPHQQADYDISMEQAIEPEPQPVKAESIGDNNVVFGSIATPTAVAAAAGVVAVAAKKIASPKVPKLTQSQTDIKKVDSKVKTAPIKKATTTTTVPAKVAARTSALKVDEKSKAVGPKTVPRIGVSKINSTAEKKTTLTSNVARKPASTGSKYINNFI